MNRKRPEPGEQTSGEHGPGTKAVHSGEAIDKETAAVTQAIHQTSIFAFRSVDEMARVFRGESPGYVYTRHSNPTLESVERKIGDLEGCERAVLFSSGMAAMSSVFLTFCGSGSHLLVARDVYGGTFQLAGEMMRDHLGVDVRFVDAGALDELEEAMAGKPTLLCVESPTNPLLRIVDLRRASELAHKSDCLFLVDNTFATPVNQNPAQLGADLVLHSASKYLGGHSDLIGGAVAGPSELIERVRKTMRLLGGCMDPHAAWLLGRSIKTLPIRVQKHNENAMVLAQFLSSHPKVDRVHYPGLPDHPQHALAATQMRGFGGVLSLELKGSADAMERFVRRLRLIVLAPSLGGVESLLLPPSVSSHRSLPEEIRKKSGISNRLVRLSVGIEDVEDLLRDLNEALDAV
jgi:cystathionine beta-lyase/cystathionine gamma-synthase